MELKTNTQLKHVFGKRALVKLCFMWNA